ncbi:ABC transporter substrate-binding protein [Paenibacillus ginsengarvi]|nr:extracellular solute-binding protein [Paenibacillus ginsengarvi]
MLKKTQGIVLASMLVLLAACGKSPGTEKQTAVSNEPVTLLVTSSLSDSLDLFNQYYGNRIRAKFPNVTLNFIPKATGQNIQDLLASNQIPDLMYSKVSNMNSYVFANGLGYELTELVKKNQYDMSRFDPAYIEKVKSESPDGGLYGMPSPDMDPQVLFYNKSIFEKFGVPFPTDGMTWDDVYELAKKMTRVEGGVTYRGFSAHINVYFRDNQLSIPYLDPKQDKMYDSEKWKKMFTNLSRFYEIPNNKVAAKDEPVAFMTGNIAMMQNQLSNIVRIPENIDWDMVSMPVYKDGPKVMNQPSSTYWFISKQSKNKDISFKIIEYLLSDELQMEIARDQGGLPSIKATAELKKAFGQNVPQLKGKHIEAVFKYPLASAPPVRDKGLTVVNQGSMGTEVNKAFDKVIKDQVDVNTALREAKEKIEGLIATEKGK